MGQNNNAGINTSEIANDTVVGASHVDIERAAKLFEESYKDLDRDRDGFVTKEELQAGFSAKNMTEEKELVFTTLAAFADNIQKLSRDEWFTDVSGITRADMHKLQSLDGKNGTDSQNKLAKGITDKLSRGLDVHDPEVFRDTATKYFGAIDQNGSGGLDRLELESFLKRDDVDARGHEVASVMLEHFQDMTHMARPDYLKHAQAQSLGFYMYDGYSTGEISRQDVQNLASLRLTPEKEIDSAKNTEYMFTRVEGGMIFVAGSACVIAGAAAALAPEPVVSKWAAAGAIGMGSLGATAGGAMLFSREDSGIEKIYQEVGIQRSAMDQWNFFKR